MGSACARCLLLVLCARERAYLKFSSAAKRAAHINGLPCIASEQLPCKFPIPARMRLAWRHTHLLCTDQAEEHQAEQEPVVLEMQRVKDDEARVQRDRQRYHVRRRRIRRGFAFSVGAERSSATRL